MAYDLAADLELLDLTGAYSTRAGASMLINCGSRRRARLWSRAFYVDYPEIQGLYYTSCMHGGSPSLALYERGAGAIPAHPAFHRALADKALRMTLRNAAARQLKQRPRESTRARVSMGWPGMSGRSPRQDR